MIKVLLRDPDDGYTALVAFPHSEEADDPSKVVFEDMALWFPFDELPNRSGHIRRDGLCSPEDFITKAEDMGFRGEIVQ